MNALGRYEIIDELGRGAMGTVFRARDPVIDRTVALKIVTPSALGTEGEKSYRQRFFREAQAAGRLSHPGIVTVYDVSEDESTKTPYIVMEYIAGRTLEDILTGTQGPLPVGQALDLGKQIADALDYAHSLGVVHRDIKPANIIVTSTGRAKITDFGVARLKQTQLTVAGALLGTPSYMSPEQVGGKETDGRSDLFSLGVMLFLMLTGQYPFTGEEVAELIFKIVSKEPPLATEINSSLSPEFNHVLGRALAKDAAQRYQAGREFVEDLEDLSRQRTPRSRTRVSSSTVGSKARSIFPESKNPAYGRPPTHKPTVLLEALGAAKSSESPRASVRREWQWWRTIPHEARIGLMAAVVIVSVALVISMAVALSPKASLQISLHSADLREGKVSVSVDDSVVAEGDIRAKDTKSLGLFRKQEGYFSENVRVPAKKHTIRVHVLALQVGYDQTREIEGDFKKDDEKMLAINPSWRSGSLYVDWK